MLAVGPLPRNERRILRIRWNLLFGMLALQLNFVTQTQLLAAIQMWLLDKNRLGDILEETKSLAADRRQLLDALVQKLEAHENDPRCSLAALGVSPSVRQALDKLRDLDINATLGNLNGIRDTAPDRSATQIPDVGESRFRILRPHAKGGGLGVVFVARDQEIGREVALKEIQRHRAHESAAEPASFSKPR
jgi:eukaryotic-like serine/threonine-protein kinase